MRGVYEHLVYGIDVNVLCRKILQIDVVDARTIIYIV